jgi:N-acetylmuramoyl-L-alanine amidase
MKSGDEALQRLCNVEAKVSSHYFIDTKGVLFQLVEENNIAWHAGESKFANFEGFNKNSIGIEVVNPGHDHGYVDFTLAQYNTLIPLCLEIMKRHPIKPQLILGHSDIAPQRKIDPGEKFNWQLLSDYGIGIFPPKDLLSPLPKVLLQKGDLLNPLIFEIQNNLSLYGYDISISGIFDEYTEKTIQAFNAHYYPENQQALWDENSQSILKWLCSLS